MTRKRWERIEQIFQAALTCPPTERRVFVSEQCCGDDALRLEVESLLSAKAQAGSFLDTPAMQVAACALSEGESRIAAGQMVGAYRVSSRLGAGGMGEVWRARDTRVDRDVAIKFCDGQFAQRFEREARAIAALNHPNICHLYDVGPNYLVMELVDGASPRGPLPFETALDYARQIADALEAAHERGIVHRDLKPGNIKITPDGIVKVLDFGLAKALPEPSPAKGSSTVTITATEAGVILGTAAYMAPEQAQGKAVDKRADIWAFGVVLYEMLTGQRLFQGDTVTDTLAAVLTREPDWESVPERARPLLQRCLVKDPKRRLRDIGDAMALLEQAPASAPARRPQPAPWMAWSAPVFLLTSLLLSFIHFLEKPSTPDLVRLQISLPENVNTAGRNFALSPDGRKLAFSAIGADGVPRVWMRVMDSLDVRELPGTETNPNTAPFFWSPDSRFVVYSTPRGELKKVDLTGSPPQTLCYTTGPNAVGGSWNRDGVIIFGSTSGALARVSAAGGTPSAVTVLDESRKETRHAFPTFLPDGRHFLYLRSSSVPENSGVYLGSLDATPEEQDSRQLLATTFGPAYLPSAVLGRGHLLVLREGSLLAQIFDQGRMELLGDPLPVVEQVGSFVASGFFSASHNGVLVYRSSDSRQNGRLAWYDREGTYLLEPEQPTGLRAALAPDAERSALVRQDPGNPLNRDIWTLDTRRTITRLTSDRRRAEDPVWSPDGRRVIFASNRDGPYSLYQKLANGSKDDEVLLKSERDKTPTGVSRDGRLLLYTQADPQTKNDIWVLSNLSGRPSDRKAMPFLQTQFNESEAQFCPGPETSPRWVAYTSDESGRNEVYVRAFSQNSTGARWQVSRTGGTNPRWRGDGQELFFASPDETVMAVDFTPAATFSAAPKALFKVPSGILPNWDVTADGKRFLVLVRLQQNARAPFTVVINWQEVLKK
ncbi:MAG: protein kinase domain-containing protein [Bryobacteraceae bacterium]